MIDIVKLSGRAKKKLVQLALDVDKVNLEKLKWPMLWSEKLDGCYCLALKVRERLSSISAGDVVYIFSRTGEVYTSMEHIQSELNDIIDIGDIVIFEAYEIGVKQSIISGHCRDTKEQHPGLKARCHDIITTAEFIHGGTMEYIDRYYRLLDLFYVANELYHCFTVDQVLVQSMDEAMELTKIVWDQGREGGVLRNPQGLYAGGVIDKLCVGTKRNADIIKLKQGVSYDLRVIGVYEGTGKYTGCLGGLECAWKDGGIINISGMTDAQRREWWDDPSSIIGRIVQVDAMCDSSNGLLREARFKGIRYDKEVADF